MRGIRPANSRRTCPAGITPACAGNTALCPFSFPACWNYPRLRGEYSLVVPPNIAAMELPPLARGILIHTPPTLNHCGITPACAGNTANPAPCIRVYRNYPRLRGEYVVTRLRVAASIELPPLARGILVALTHKSALFRNYPRLRGEYRR